MAVDRTTLIGAVVFAAVFALFALMQSAPFDSVPVRGVALAALFGLYCGLVALGKTNKRRPLSHTAQTILGVLAATAMAAVLGADAQGYSLAVVLGLVLGFTADKWVWFVSAP